MSSSTSSRAQSKSKKMVLFVGLAALAIAGASYYWVNFKKIDGSKVVAKAAGYDVTLDEANERIKLINGGKETDVSFVDLPEEKKIAVIKDEVANRMLVRDARSKKLISDQDLAKRTKIFQDNLFRQAMVESIVKGENLTEDKLKKIYEEKAKKIEGQKEIRAKHILLDTEKEAERIKKKLKDEPFSELAAKYSLDKSTATKGGDLGVLYTGNMMPAFDEAIKNLKVGDVSDPVKTTYGWHIIKLDSRKDPEVLPYEKVKQKLLQDLLQGAVNQYIAELVKDVKVDLTK